MHVVLLKFAGNRDRASALMEAHKSWINQGFEEGVFVLVGTIKPQNGGVLLAVGATHEALAARVAQDPFVGEGVVTAEILEISPGRVDERVALLAGS